MENGGVVVAVLWYTSTTQAELHTEGTPHLHSSTAVKTVGDWRYYAEVFLYLYTF